jgi:DNA-binding transcriptional MocR family regulator
MNSGATSERVYDALKRQILHRRFLPGARLDPAQLATTLASSVTPVRDALHLLTGQGLVEAQPNGGFHMPLVSEPALRDLYAWNAQLLLLALRDWPSGALDAPMPGPPGDAAGQTAMLFGWIAARSANAEHGRAVAAANDRLHAPRLAEAALLAGDPLAAIRAALPGERAGLRRAISAYHRDRIRRVPAIVRALYRDTPPA